MNQLARAASAAAALGRLARAFVANLFAEVTLESLRIPSVLLVVVVVAHMGYDPIGSLYATNQERAATAWHSVLRAYESTVLYLAVWLLIPWRPVLVRLAGSLVCAWGAIESFQIAAWRLQFPMNQPPPATALYSSLGDAKTGWPIYMLTIALVLAVAVLVRVFKKKE